MASNRLFSTVYTRYLRDVQVISGLMPAEYRSLAHLLRSEKPAVRLRDGSTHLFDREELERLASHVPWYMHALTMLPIVVVKEGDTYRLVCDRWSLRAVAMVLRGELVHDPDPALRLGELERLVREYRSLVFVAIRTGEQQEPGHAEE